MDLSLFHLINGMAGHAGWLDRLLIWGSKDLTIVLVLLMAGAWFWPGSTLDRAQRERLVVYAVAAALLGLGIAQIIAHLWFRERPYINHSAHLLVGPSADPSFPSDHAVGGFALAMPFVIAGRRFGWFLLAVATLLAVSRVAVGTHYPGDILGGALLGTAAAATVWSLRRYLEPPLVHGLRLAQRLHLA